MLHVRICAGAARQRAVLPRPFQPLAPRWIVNSGSAGRGDSSPSAISIRPAVQLGNHPKFRRDLRNVKGVDDLLKHFSFSR
jgi:hypothetical protein